VRKLPNAGSYLPQLDGIRAIAVTLVLLVHCVMVPDHGLAAWILRNVLSNGWIGVDLFFALSGYLITSILLRARTRPHYFRNFYARRFLRIFPPYYAVIAVLAVAAAWLPFGPLRPAWPYLTYTSNLYLVFAHWEWRPLGHTWSLAIEEQFYLCYPILVLWLTKARLRQLLWIVIAASPLVRVIMNAMTFPAASAFTTFCRLDVLAMGAVLAIEFDGLTEISDRAAHRLRLIFGGLLFASALLFVTKQLDAKTVFFNGVSLTIIEATAAMFICVAVAAPIPILDRMLRLPAAVGMGRISYGIYLYHYPIVRIVERQAKARMADTWPRTAVIASMSVGLTIVVSVLSWFVLERPVLRLKKWFYDAGEEAARVEKVMIEAPVAASLRPETGS
jgi:peptidoglycan/LPS O-acetylase OafA/YrhL